MSIRIADYVGETTEYDKKESLEKRKPRSWLKSVSAFANTRGGTLLFGVANNDELTGLEDAKGDAEIISETVKSRMDPVPDVTLSIHSESNKHFIILDVKAGAETPYYFVDGGTRTAYVRIGNESVPANAAMLRRLVMHGTERQFDAMSSRYKKENLAFTKLRSFYSKQTGTELDESDFISFGLVDANGMATNAGVLLADDPPVRYSRVFCTRWAGLDKASGVTDAIDDKEFDGNLISLLQDTTTFIRLNTKKRWKKNGNGRVEMPEYPERAVFESVVNALIHRDYLDTGSEVHVDIFEDRIEIYSPGGMPDGSFVQDLDPKMIPSRRRNPVIADVFGRMNLMERRGSGFRKIMADYHNASNFRPSLEPKLISTPTSFFVILYNLNYGVPVEKHPDATEKGALKASDPASDGEKVALQSSDLASDGKKVASEPLKQAAGGEKVALQSSEQALGDKKVASEYLKQAVDGKKVALQSSEQVLCDKNVSFASLLKQISGDQKAAFECRAAQVISSAPTRRKVLLLFDRHDYHGVFGRSEVMELTGLASSSAGKFLNRLKKLGLIEQVSGYGRGKYHFIYTPEDSRLQT